MIKNLNYQDVKLVGPKALGLYNIFKIKPKTTNVFKAFEEYCNPSKNEFMKHFCFFL